MKAESLVPLRNEAVAWAAREVSNIFDPDSELRPAPVRARGPSTCDQLGFHVRKGSGGLDSA